MSKTMKWELDEELVESVLEILNTHPTESDSIDLVILEALGTLVYAGAHSKAQDYLRHNRGRIAKEAVEEALLELDSEDLDGASLALSRLLIEITDAEEEQRDALADRILVLLSKRDRLELCLAGARFVLDTEPPLDVELESSIDAFDELLAPELWRAVTLGERRWARVAWATPEYRKRMWWWSKGANLPANALDAMKTTAELLNTFEEAAHELEIRRAGEAQFSQLVRKEPVADNVLSLRDYLFAGRERQSAGLGVPRLDQIRAAAASEDVERLVHSNAEMDVSVSRAHLIVDRKGTLDEDSSCSVKICVEGLDDLDADVAFPGRFQFSLAAPHFSLNKGTLLMQWGKGSLEVKLPFGEET